MNFRDILLGQRTLLDSLFGEGVYRIESDDPYAARIRTDWMDLALTYDWRDQWVASDIKPLRVPGEDSGYHTSDSLLRFCNVQTGIRRKSALDEQQVIDELSLIAPLVSLLKDERKSSDATWFVRGYNHAYTDWASGQWDV